MKYYATPYEIEWAGGVAALNDSGRGECQEHVGVAHDR